MLYEVITVKEYIINPVDSYETSLEEYKTLDVETATPADIEILSGFAGMTDDDCAFFAKEYGLAMSVQDRNNFV